jgi:hypothetical protein
VFGAECRAANRDHVDARSLAMSPGSVLDPGAVMGVSRMAFRLLPAAEAGIDPFRIAVLAPP